MAGSKNRSSKIIAVFILLLLAGLLASLLSLKTGAIPLSWGELHRVFSGRGGTEPEMEMAAAIVFRLRLPRLILGLIVGGGLAVAGVIFQGLFRNPLVEPYTLGVSGGAALGVSIGILAGSSRALVFLPLLGFAGALLAVSLAYAIARRRKFLKISYLLLIGVMISFISSALIMLLLSVSSLSQFRTVVFWAMGSLEGSTPGLLRIAVPVILLGVILAWSRSWGLNGLALGEEGALHLGIPLEREKRLLFFLGSLLAGTAVSVSGVIGFVGLVIPHSARLLIGSDHRFLTPASFLLGAIFLVICDTIARTVLAPVELPVGVITGIAGGSLFIYLLSRRAGKKDGGTL